MLKRILKNILPLGVVKSVQSEFRKETHINRALSSLNGGTYVEIGVAEGNCFRQVAASRKIAVDPAPKGFGHSLTPGESLFEMTSDEFFSACAERILALREVDVAFVDGLHEFPQALRDILNLEKFMSRKGIIFIHDCNPPTRQNVEKHTEYWTGDVWKCAYYITTYRPDLRFFTLNCDWGLGVLTGFGSSPTFERPSPETVNTCTLLDYSFLEHNRKRILRLRPFWYSRFFFDFAYTHHVSQGQESHDRRK